LLCANREIAGPGLSAPVFQNHSPAAVADVFENVYLAVERVCRHGNQSPAQGLVELCWPWSLDGRGTKAPRRSHGMKQRGSALPGAVDGAQGAAAG
jgi:hypothetical protein